ncbi:hypothetical protein MycrhDRAFT_4117 [Mycolicibacterium rhodesiae JS60]|nr:hypothetical protein MycrhDRAFT_4117 [Mycolicibacterium rhodesiae JS60]
MYFANFRDAMEVVELAAMSDTNPTPEEAAAYEAWLENEYEPGEGIEGFGTGRPDEAS